MEIQSTDIKNTEYVFNYKKEKKTNPQRPTNAFIGASWTGLFIGMTSYCIALWNGELALSEKGYYFTILLFGLFSAISLQKSVRDRLEGIKVTDIYYGVSWVTTITSILLLIIGLWNADMILSEKGFYGIAFILSIFAVVAVQKNIRDISFIDNKED